MNDAFNLHDGLGYKLSLASRQNSQHFESELAKLNLTRQMWCVLVAVGQQGITNPTEIADYIGIIRTAGSRSLRHMETVQLVKRNTVSTDRRKTVISLTPKGEKALQDSLPLAQAARAQLENRLTPDDRQHLERLLQKLTQAPAKTATRI